MQPYSCSYSVDTPDSIERELVLPVPRARVWAALTEPEALNAWFGTRAIVDLQPGGSLTFIWEDAHGGRFTISQTRKRW